MSTRPLTVLALDPGLSLGWALRTPDGLVTSGTLDLRSRRFSRGRYADAERYVLTREQIIEQISEGDPHRKKLAEQLFNAPRSFAEGANDSTKKLAKSVG